MFRNVLISLAAVCVSLTSVSAFGAAAAIAFSASDGRVAWTLDASSTDDAGQRSVAALTAEDKRVVISTENGWCAIAKCNRTFGWAQGSTRAEAEQAATAACAAADGSGAQAHVIDVVFSGTDDEPGYAIESVSPAELRNFYGMYGDAGLDSDTINTLYQGWERATRAERKTQFDDFKAKIQEIEDAETPVSIRIVNPEKYGVTWSYLMNGTTMSLEPGYSQDLERRCTIEFATGNGSETKSYRLDEGVYTLAYADDHWDLQMTASDVAAATLHDPETPREEVMYNEMYADSGLDVETLQTARKGWMNLTSAQRQSQYDEFQSKIKEAQESAEAHFRIVNQASNKVAWSFLIDDKQQTLNAGEERDCQGKSKIKINLGGSVGEVEYSLSKGVYSFGPEGDHWAFSQVSADADVADDSPAHGDPITADDEQMFKKMYGDAGLDEQSTKAVREGWEKLTSAARQSQFDEFQSKIKQAVEAATPEDIHILNPASNNVSWSYLVNDKPHTLAAGAEQRLDRKATLRCNLGGQQTESEYALESGAYVFQPDGDHWRLTHRADAAGAEPPAEAVSPHEQKMFDEMYNEASLDPDTLKTLRQGWQNSTAAERESQYAKFKSAISAGSSVSASETAPPGSAETSEPVTSAEQKMFDEMYKNADLDSNTFKLVQDAWKSYSHAQRKTQYDQMLEKIKQVGINDQNSAPAASQDTRDPVTADERKMFDEMYKDADLDGPTRKILQTGWAESTHDERKKQHDEFMAKIAEALHNASAIPQSVKQ